MEQLPTVESNDPLGTDREQLVDPASLPLPAPGAPTSPKGRPRFTGKESSACVPQDAGGDEGGMMAETEGKKEADEAGMQEPGNEGLAKGHMTDEVPRANQAPDDAPSHQRTDLRRIAEAQSPVTHGAASPMSSGPHTQDTRPGNLDAWARLELAEANSAPLQRGASWRGDCDTYPPNVSESCSSPMPSTPHRRISIRPDLLPSRSSLIAPLRDIPSKLSTLQNEIREAGVRYSESRPVPYSDIIHPLYLGEQQHRGESEEGQVPSPGQPTDTDRLTAEVAPKVEKELAKMSLFFDLVLVAVLYYFSFIHEVSTPGTIPSFLLYFLVLSCIWESQAAYDIECQRFDPYHLLLKTLQIILLLLIGATSHGWNLTEFLKSSIDGHEAILHDNAVWSFNWISIWYASQIGLQRLTLIFMLVLFYWEQQLDRRYYLRSVCRSYCMTPVTILLVILTAALPSWNKALRITRITLLCLVVATDCFEGLTDFISDKVMSKPIQKRIVKRYGELTLIFLGEGFISFIRIYGVMLSGIVPPSAGVSVQVLLVSPTIFLIWLFTLAGTLRRDTVTYRRQAWWRTGLYPLHFCLLLFLAAMDNYLISLSFAHGSAFVTQEFNLSLNTILSGATLDSTHQTNIVKYFDALDLVPSYTTMLDKIQGHMNSSTYDSTLLGWQYYGQIAVQTAKTYGVDVSEQFWDSLRNLSSIEPLVNANVSLEGRQAQAKAIARTLLSEPIENVFPGTLWLYPCAGFLLLICSWQTYLGWPSECPSKVTVLCTQSVAGAILCFTGFVAWGEKPVEVVFGSTITFKSSTALYELVLSKAALAPITAVYFVSFAWPTLVRRCWPTKRERNPTWTGTFRERLGEVPELTETPGSENPTEPLDHTGHPIVSGPYPATLENPQRNEPQFTNVDSASAKGVGFLGYDLNEQGSAQPPHGTTPQDERDSTTGNPHPPVPSNTVLGGELNHPARVSKTLFGFVPRSRSSSTSSASSSAYAGSSGPAAASRRRIHGRFTSATYEQTFGGPSRIGSLPDPLPGTAEASRENAEDSQETRDGLPVGSR